MIYYLVKKEIGVEYVYPLTDQARPRFPIVFVIERNPIIKQRENISIYHADKPDPSGFKFYSADILLCS